MKQKTKRILAFAMAVVFALSTCVTSSPYTVMATGSKRNDRHLLQKREAAVEKSLRVQQKQEHLEEAVKEAR